MANGNRTGGTSGNGRTVGRGSGAKKRDPVRIRAQILHAGSVEFARHGLAGARVDRIAERSGANKRMLYYYFGNKNSLYLAVLEQAYVDIRTAEQKLALLDMPPAEGVKRLIEFTWNYYLAHPEFLTMLNTENLHRAKHLKRSRHIRSTNSPLIETLREILRRGAASGEFRRGVDALQLYISMASLSYFYLSNTYTLSVVFSRNLKLPAARRQRLAHMTEVVLGYLRPQGKTAGKTAHRLKEGN